MPAKVRILTRKFDLSVEGDSVEEVGRLIELLEVRGLSPTSGLTTADQGGIMARAESAPTMSAPSGSAAEGLVGTSLGGLDAFPAERLPSLNHEAGAIRAVTKRDGDVYVLSPKFPPKADGGERVEDAVMVLLGAFDAAGEGSVTGYYLVMALRKTGYSMSRVDKTVESLEQRGLVLVSGTRRGRAYSLSESGRAEARKLASELAAQAGKVMEAAP